MATDWKKMLATDRASMPKPPETKLPPMIPPAQPQAAPAAPAAPSTGWMDSGNNEQTFKKPLPKRKKIVPPKRNRRSP